MAPMLFRIWIIGSVIFSILPVVVMMAALSKPGGVDVGAAVMIFGSWIALIWGAFWVFLRIVSWVFAAASEPEIVVHHVVHDQRPKDGGPLQ